MHSALSEGKMRIMAIVSVLLCLACVPKLDYPKPSQLLSGCGVIYDTKIIKVEPCSYVIKGMVFKSEEALLPPKPSDTKPRIDMVAVDDSGKAVLVPGIAAEHPVFPSMRLPRIPLTFIYVNPKCVKPCRRGR